MRVFLFYCGQQTVKSAKEEEIEMTKENNAGMSEILMQNVNVSIFSKKVAETNSCGFHCRSSDKLLCLMTMSLKLLYFFKFTY